MRAIKLLVIVGCFLSLSVTAQITNYYGGCADDHITSVLSVPNGIYLCGYTKSFRWGGWEIYLVKMDTSGNVKWAKTYSYGANPTNSSGKISLLKNGNLLLNTSYSSSGSNASGKLEIDSSGNLINASKLTSARPYIPSTDGGFYINSVAGGPCAQTPSVTKLDSAGDFLYADSLTSPCGGSTSYPNLFSLVNTRDTGFIVLGDRITGPFHPFLWKCDKTGHTQWVRDIANTSDLYYLDPYVLLENNKGYLVPAITYDAASPSSQYLSIKQYDQAGNALWYKRLLVLNSTSNYWTSHFNVLDLNDGTFLLTSQLDSMPGGTQTFSNYYAVRFDSVGQVLWSNRYGPNGVYPNCMTSPLPVKVGNDILLCGESNNNVAGNSISPVAPQYDLYVIKIDINGNPQGTVPVHAVHTMTTSLTETNVSQPTFSTVYSTTGFDSFQGDTAQVQIVSAFYDSSTCIGVGIGTVGKPSGLAIFPNPANTQVTIVGSRDQEYEMTLLNMQGEVICQQHFFEEMRLRIGDLSKGLYFVKVKDRFAETYSKLIICD